MSSSHISAHYTDEQLRIFRQIAEILGISVEELLGKANHPGKIADLEPAEESVKAPNSNSDERGVLCTNKRMRQESCI